MGGNTCKSMWCMRARVTVCDFGGKSNQRTADDTPEPPAVASECRLQPLGQCAAVLLLRQCAAGLLSRATLDHLRPSGSPGYGSGFGEGTTAISCVPPRGSVAIAFFRSRSARRRLPHVLYIHTYWATPCDSTSEMHRQRN